MDFNNDGADDLVLVYLDDTGTVQKSFVRMFLLSPNHQFIKYGETVLDSSIASVSAIQSDELNFNGNRLVRVFVDCAKNDRMIFTELVYWDSAHAVPVRAYTEPSVTNLRSASANCRDIDNDGLLEIPSLTQLYGDENTFTVKTDTDSFTFTLLKWNNAVGDKNGVGISTLLNPLDYYFMIFTWGNRVTVKYDSLRQALVFCEWDEAKKQTGNELFLISRRVTVAENEIVGELLAETEHGVYYYQITEAGYGFGVSDDFITSSFIKYE